MNQQQINDRISHYTGQGWSILCDNDFIGFISSCGRWFHSFDKSTGNMVSIDKKWVEKMRKYRKKDDILE